jgi:hypothetical protein
MARAAAGGRTLIKNSLDEGLLVNVNQLGFT